MSKTVADTLAERAKTYGDFKDIARISQALQATLRAGRNWDAMSLSGRETLQAICSKMARILNGDPEYVDNWHDIAGYATLEEQRILEADEKIAEKVAVAALAPLATPPDGFEVEHIGGEYPWRARRGRDAWTYGATHDAALDAAQKAG